MAPRNATVRAGPFAGLTYPRDQLADVDAPVAKLVGCYEQEIAATFREALADGVDVFVDVGSADGYYAVGMAVRSPSLTTHAYDLSRSARNLCAAIAALNGVDARVRLGSSCDTAALARLPLDGALLLCDIEGGEGEFFVLRPSRCCVARVSSSKRMTALSQGWGGWWRAPSSTATRSA